MSKYGFRPAASLGVLCVLATASFSQQETGEPAPSPLRGLPLTFVENVGQLPEECRFQARLPALSASLFDDGWALLNPLNSARLRIRFQGGESTSIRGEEPLDARANFLGSAEGESLSAQLYRRVVATEMLPGVDAVYYERDGKLEYDLHLDPGTQVETIVFALEGVEQSGIKPDGSLEIRLGRWSVRQDAPRTWQIHPDGRLETLRSEFRRVGAVEEHRYGFRVFDRDAELPLVIDPVLVYSEFIGGSNADEALDVAVDATGNVYVTGWAKSSDFPFGRRLTKARRKGSDAVVFKLDPSGTRLVYATYIGGSGDEQGRAIEVNGLGEAFIVGRTRSSDFPTTHDAFGRSKKGNHDAFALRLSADGSELLYSTFIGGAKDDEANGVALSEDDYVYVVGSTKSNDFPSSSFSFQPERRSGRDAFLLKLGPEGKVMVFGTYLGGIKDDEAFDVALDPSGHAYVAGVTDSVDFPATENGFDGTKSGVDGFVAKFNVSASGLVYATFLGGSGNDEVRAVVVDDDLQANVVGSTRSADFPTTRSAWSETDPGRKDGFYARVSISGSTLDYATYVGGSGIDELFDLDLDAFGTPWLVGRTGSRDFPTTYDAEQPRFGGEEDAFLVSLDPSSGQMVYSTFLGRGGQETAYAVRVQPYTQSVLVAGTADEIDPEVRGRWSGDKRGPSDALVARYEPGACSSRAELTMLGAGCGAHLTSDVPRLGQVMTLEITGAPPNARGFLLVSGRSNASILVEELCEVHVDPDTTRVLQTFMTDERGGYTLAVRLPRADELCGQSFILQATVSAVEKGPLSFGQLSEGLLLTYGN